MFYAIFQKIVSDSYPQTKLEIPTDIPVQNIAYPE